MTGNTPQGNARPEPAPILSQHDPTAPFHIIDGQPAASTPAPPTDDEWDRTVRQATENVARIETLNATSNQRGNSWALPVAEGQHARTPTWTSRPHWQHQVRTLLNSPNGTQLCKTHTVSTETVFAVAVTHAHHADSKTGRSITASRNTIATRAGVSISAVKRARRVLTALGVAIELVRGRYLQKIESMAAEAHHGHRQFRAASVWALISPRTAVTTITAPFKELRKPSRATLRTAEHRARTAPRTSPQNSGRGPLSPSWGFVLPSLVFKFSPTHAHTRAGKPKNTQKPTPRPIELQRTAAQLIAHIPALKTTRHVGQICDVLDQAGIDPARWTGRDIARELTADTQTRGWVWPTQLTRPTSFLRWRLAHIDWTAQTPAERARENDRTRLAEQAERWREARERDSHVADAHARAQIMKQLREQLSTRTPA
ncbi:replication protein [Rhodococcus sp. KBS0724]|uniref:replication protein n=1 Tax=Rhodococcus sp. KBS0724 TaxID=1179674 RepID=UPI00110D7B4B|nr:replication protein [Rhodococcus sp. KBS0724]TSD40454.1 replication protein [Rhodococcus sp. KBS0724]